MGLLDVRAEDYSFVNFVISPDNCDKGNMGNLLSRQESLSFGQA